MTTAELVEIIEALRSVETETPHVEAKRARHDLPRRLWETISAFSNTPGGGAIILGVDEEGGFAVVGVETPRKIQQDLASLCQEMEPPVRPVIDLHRLRGRTVVSAEIPEVAIAQKPCYYKGAGLTNGAFIRVADGDRKLSSYEVQVMLASRGQPREDEMPVPEATPGALDPELVGLLLGRLRATEGGPFRRLRNEEALGILRVLVRHEERWVPSLGGLLALGRYPQQFFPTLTLTIVVYPSARPGEPGPHGERFLDNRKIEGPIPRMIEPALATLKRNMKRRAVVRGLFREDLWEYPETAIREALVNALAHRDLSGFARGTPVQVEMFPDRLVITNPGGLHGPVTIDRLGEGLCASRNQALMKLLEDTPPPGEARAICENRGSGVGAMLAALRQAGMSPPRFEDRVSTFAVTFPNHTLLDEETLAWLERLRGIELTDSQRFALAALRHGQALTNRSYCQLTGVDSRVATRELSRLVAEGLAQQHGTRRWASYALPEGTTGPATGARPGGQPARPALPWMLQGRRATRADRRGEIVALLGRVGPLSRADVARRLGLSDAAARKWLAILRAEGRVDLTTSSPRSRHVRYRLPSRRRRQDHAT